MSSFCSPLNSIPDIPGIISVVTAGIISVVIGGHFGGGDHFDGGNHFCGGTTLASDLSAQCWVIRLFSSNHNNILPLLAKSESSVIVRDRSRHRVELAWHIRFFFKKQVLNTRMIFLFLGSNLRSSVSFQGPSYYNSSGKEKDSPSLSSFKTKLRKHSSENYLLKTLWLNFFSSRCLFI